MAKENPRHNALSWSEFVAAFYRVLSAEHIEVDTHALMSVVLCHGLIAQLQARRRTDESKVLPSFFLSKTEVYGLGNPICQDKVNNLGAEPSRNIEKDSILTEEVGCP
jgi:hypothetical protein